MGRQPMEGLALKQQQIKHARREIIEVSPYLLVEKACALAPEISKVIHSFWDLHPRIRLFSISPNPHYYWHLQDFYVAQKGLDNEGKRWAQLRISENLCQLFFNKTLGVIPGAEEFSLAQIHHFEVFLLERFSRQLFQLLSPHLIKKPPKKAPPPDQDKLMHLLWILESDQEDEANQLIFSLPQVCLKSEWQTPPAEKVKWALGYTPYLHARVNARFQVGKTWAKLEELKDLEVGDLIVFEDSSTTKWHLHSPKDGALLPFPVQLPANAAKINIPLAQGTDAMANQLHPDDIWDNLQVEVTGTFSPFKLPLKRLKEIERGLIIEMSDLMDNRVQIEVEGHRVAWGELLVIGDKLGVRIQGLHDKLEQSEHSPSAKTSADIVPHQHGEVSHRPEAPTEQPTQNGGGGGNEDLMDELGLEDSDFDDMDNEEDWT